VAKGLIPALRSGSIREVGAAVKANALEARQPKAVVEAGRLAFQAALELIHKHGADLNASYRNYRALHALIQEKPEAQVAKTQAERLKCLDWLLSHGADPEELGAWPKARTLIIAAFAGRRAYVKRLQKAGARMDGFTGAALGDCDLVEKALREQPGFARARDQGILTALQCAAGSRVAGPAAREVARLLLDAGAEPDARTRSWGEEVDAASFAVSAGNAAVFRLLLDRGASADAALWPAVWKGHWEMAKSALERGAGPDRCAKDGRPLLNDLIRWGQIGQMMWLLERGANPNLPDSSGWTAVHQAASMGNLRIMTALMEAGGDPLRPDHHSRTPIRIAQASGRHKLVAVIAARK